MRSLLDEIIDNIGSPTIVSEEHDTSQVDWRAAMMDTAEMVKVGRDVVVAANGRAALDASTGRVAVMVAGKPAWHKLGVNVAQAVSSAHAIKLASLNWNVTKRPMAYLGPNGQWVESDDTFSLTRDDTGAKLGTVGSKYQPIQNAEAFEFMDSLLGTFGARYETAGAIYGGKKVWMLVCLHAQA